MTDDTLSPRPASLAREMTTWSYGALKRLFDGNEEFALYVTVADNEAVLFSETDRLWMFTRAPSTGWDQCAPEVIEDWIGSSAPKEPGGEPVLMHREELPGGARGLPEYVRERDPEHVYKKLERFNDD